MTVRRAGARLCIALLALGSALAPAVASIADARPAALAISQRFAPHVEPTGARHGVRQHLDNCALCGFVARLFVGSSTPDFGPVVEPAPGLPDAPTISWRTASSRWIAPARAPPA
jgi:hypothetical protein